MVKVNRNIVSLIKKGQEKEFERIEGDGGYLLGLVWEITKDAWAFHGGVDAEQRLQRHVTKIVRRRGKNKTKHKAEQGN